jgi:hypothetical protein
MTTEQRDEEAQILNRVCEIVREYPESDWDRLIHEIVPDHLRRELNIAYGIEAICGARHAPSSGKLFPHQRGEK